MKTLGLKKMLSLFFLLIGGLAYGQSDRIEVPGDHFSLEGALELFKKSASPEEFERLLNDPESKVNNLDLNGDGYIDYIRVIDRNEGNVHTFILQAVISERESQDIAVIALEKLANGKAVLQITGDEDIYGIETIIEPTQEVRVNAGASTNRAVVNVWSWPSVQYVYSPYYTSAWVSPWGWNNRPVWWRPWRPVAYHVYDPYWHAYRPYYTICRTPRVVYAHNIYRPYRTTSVVVYNRHYTQVNHYRTTHQNNPRHGRDRYDGGRSNGRFDNSRNRETTGRQRSTTNQYGTNSRSTNTDRTRTQQAPRNAGSDNGRVSEARREESSTRTAPNQSREVRESRSGSPNSQRNTSPTQQRQEVQRSRTESSPANSGARQQVTRPSSDNRNSQPQRSSTVQPQRSSTVQPQRSQSVQPQRSQSVQPQRSQSVQPQRSNSGTSKPNVQRSESRSSTPAQRSGERRSGRD